MLLTYLVVSTKDTLCVGLARVGHKDQRIVSGTLEELRYVDFGSPLHCFIIPGNLHIVEKEALEQFNVHNNPDITYLPKSNQNNNNEEEDDS